MLTLAHGQGNPNARIVFIRDFPPFEDVRRQKHFSDGAGAEFTRMCTEAGIVVSDTFVTTISRQTFFGRAPDYFSDKKKNTDIRKKLFRGIWVHEAVLAGLESLKGELAAIQPNIIVPLGPLALFLCNGTLNVSTWRGSVGWSDSFNCKYIATYDPAQILRVWSWRYACVRDLQRVEAESHYPELKLPEYKFIIKPSYAQAMGKLQELINRADGG